MLFCEDIGGVDASCLEHPVGALSGPDSRPPRPGVLHECVNEARHVQAVTLLSPCDVLRRHVDQEHSLYQRRLHALIQRVTQGDHCPDSLQGLLKAVDRNVLPDGLGGPVIVVQLPARLGPDRHDQPRSHNVSLLA